MKIAHLIASILLFSLAACSNEEVISEIENNLSIPIRLLYNDGYSSNRYNPCAEGVITELVDQFRNLPPLQQEQWVQNFSAKYKSVTLKPTHFTQKTRNLETLLIFWTPSESHNRFIKSDALQKKWNTSNSTGLEPKTLITQAETLTIEPQATIEFVENQMFSTPNLELFQSINDLESLQNADSENHTLFSHVNSKSAPKIHCAPAPKLSDLL